MKLLPRKHIDADDNIGKGMDLALTVLLFLGLGFALDRWLDTKPVFMIVLSVLALVGKVAGMYYGYQATMERLEAERRATSAQAPRAQVPLPVDLTNEPLRIDGPLDGPARPRPITPSTEIRSAS